MLTPRHLNYRLAALLALTAGLVAAVMLPAPAQAVDVDVGDFVPAPPGTTAGLLYYQHAERDALYAQGRRLDGEPRLRSDIGIARLVHYTEIGGLTIAPQVLLPFGRISASGDTSALGSARGTGDITFAMPVWLINDPAARTYLGVAPYLNAPTGRYDRNDALNLGENRWRFTAQVGLVKGLSERWWIDLTGDATFFGKNDDFGPESATLRQRTLYQGQGYLRYQYAPGNNLFVGLSQTWGGETRVDGVGNDDEPRQRKFSVGVSHFVRPTTQLLVAVGRDLEVENGFRENGRVNLRLLQIF